MSNLLWFVVSLVAVVLSATCLLLDYPSWWNLVDVTILVLSTSCAAVFWHLGRSEGWGSNGL